VTPTPEEIDEAERANFSRLTQEALRRHAETLGEHRSLLDNTLVDGLEDD
jgi:hypothetical protein